MWQEFRGLKSGTSVHLKVCLAKRIFFSSHVKNFMKITQKQLYRSLCSNEAFTGDNEINTQIDKSILDRSYISIDMTCKR